MILPMLLLFLILAIVLLDLGFSIRYGAILQFVSGMLIIFTGVIVLTSGIEIQSGFSIIENTVTNTTITASYQNFDTGIYRSFGGILLAVGAYILFSAAYNFIFAGKGRDD